MRAALLWTVVLLTFAAAAHASSSPLDLPLEQRLDAPRKIASASLKLTDFVGFLGNTYKVPLLVETTSPVPDLAIPSGTFSARQLLDLAVQQLHGYEWKSEKGVAHLYRRDLAGSQGNLLNLRIHRFTFPKNVAEFVLEFRQCLYSIVQHYDCRGGAIEAVAAAALFSEPLPYLESFNDVDARSILLALWRANGRFYVLIAYESGKPTLTSNFALQNWFTQSVIPDATVCHVCVATSARQDSVAATRVSEQFRWF